MDTIPSVAGRQLKKNKTFKFLKKRIMTSTIIAVCETKTFIRLQNRRLLYQILFKDSLI